MKYSGKPRRVPVRILAATLDDVQLDSEDTDRVHVWVTHLAWSPRRAFLTQGSVFLRAAGFQSACPSQGAVESLVGQRFMVHVIDPDFIPAPAERILFTNVELVRDLAEFL